MTFNPEPRILMVGGSPRANGNTDAQLKAAADGAKSQGISSTIIQLRKYDFSPCVGCEACRKAKACTCLLDGMQLLYPEIEACQGLILASPTHNYNVTAWMKAFIDRLYCYYNFTNDHPRAWSSRLADQNRAGAVLSVCEQVDRKDMGFTMEAMELPMEALGYKVLNKVGAMEHFHKGAIKKDQPMMDAAFETGEMVAKTISGK